MSMVVLMCAYSHIYAEPVKATVCEGSHSDFDYFVHKQSRNHTQGASAARYP